MDTPINKMSRLILHHETYYQGDTDRYILDPYNDNHVKIVDRIRKQLLDDGFIVQIHEDSINDEHRIISYQSKHVIVFKRHPKTGVLLFDKNGDPEYSKEIVYIRDEESDNKAWENWLKVGSNHTKRIEKNSLVMNRDKPSGYYYIDIPAERYLEIFDKFGDPVTGYILKEFNSPEGIVAREFYI